MERTTSREVSASEPFAAAKLRGQERKRRMLESSGGTLSSEQVANLLGISVESVEELRSRDQLLGLAEGQGYNCPSFQFRDGKTIAGLEETLAELKDLDPWMQMGFFANPHEWLEGKTPLEQLRKGLVNEVKRAASGYGEHGVI
jgi:hypothetical protein